MIDTNLLITSLPSLLKGALVSLQIAAGASFIGFFGGVVLGVIQAKKTPVLGSLALVYTALFRGTPMLIQLSLAFFLLPSLGVTISAFWIAMIAIGCNSIAYVGQVIRSGIGSVDKGQLEAAQTLGLTKWQTTRYILLPQAIRVIIPALGNEFITLVKDSSLASVIGVHELTKAGSIIKSQTYDALTSYLGVALIYFILTSTLSWIMYKIEKKVNHHA